MTLFRPPDAESPASRRVISAHPDQLTNAGCGGYGRALTLTAAFLVSFTPVVTGNAWAQQAASENGATDIISAGRPTSLIIRGTTGSGEQEAVFEEPLLSRADPETADDDNFETGSIRDTSDPVRQLQGRARPVQPEPPVVDPLITDTPSARSNVRTSASQQGTGALPQEDPFAPVGFRIGTWNVFTSIAQFLGYSTNVNSVAMGDGGSYSQTDATILMQSDWSRHSARIEANGNYRRYLDSDSPDLPTGDIKAGLTLDLVDGVTADSELGYNYTTESATSTNITDAAVNRPGVHTRTGALGVSRTGGKLVYTLRGSVGRTDYEAIELDSGGSQSQDDRNNTLYTMTGRIGYQTSPAFTPYVEGELGRRVYDEKTDRNGDKRESTIAGISVGTDIDISEKLIGNVALGYKVENFEDGNLDDLGGLTLNGSLTWSPARETTLTFNARTDFSGSTSAGQNGSIINEFGVTAERRVNDRLSLNADAQMAINRQDDRSRTDQIVTVGTGFNYWINRFMAFTGRAEYVNQRSTVGPAEEFDATSIQAGIRLQR